MLNVLTRVALLLCLALAPSVARAGFQSGLIAAVTTIEYDIGGRLVPVMVINFVPGTPYNGAPVQPPCVAAANPDWVFDLSTENGKQAATSIRLGFILGRQVRIGSRETCVLTNVNQEDGNLVTLF